MNLQNRISNTEVPSYACTCLAWKKPLGLSSFQSCRMNLMWTDLVCLAVTGMCCINSIQHLSLQGLKFLEQGNTFSSKSAPQHSDAKPMLPGTCLQRSLGFRSRKTQVLLLAAAQVFKALRSAEIPKHARPSWKSWKIGRSHIQDMSS